MSIFKSVFPLLLVFSSGTTAEDCNDPFWCQSAKSLCVQNQFIRSHCKIMCNVCKNGTWSQWNAWSACDVVCGRGQALRSRSCQTPGKCSGHDKESRTCNTQACTNVQCPDIESIRYGDFHTYSKPPYRPGTVANFTCDTGFKGIGRSGITCLGNGRWSGPIPYCTAFICRRNVKKLHVGQTCRKRCRKDRECRGAFKKCECDGWCGKSCFNPYAECPELPEPSNGYIIGHGRTYGRTVTYGCDNGFTLSGPPTRRCMSNRKWSGYPPLCVPFSACGQTVEGNNQWVSGKVTKGSDAKEGAWPWQVNLIANDQYSSEQIYNPKASFAGGTVINEKWVLSAAHVIEAVFPQNLKNQIWRQTFLLVLGMTTYPRQGLVIPEYIQIFDPVLVRLHPRYDKSSFDYDVALIRIGKRLQEGKFHKFVVDESSRHGRISFSRFIRPVCLPCMSGDRRSSVDLLKNFDKEKCHYKIVESVMVTGFGVTSHGVDDSPRTLQAGRLRIVDSWRCAASVIDIQRHSPQARFTGRMFCASSANQSENVDSCQGDSGGPVVAKIKVNNQFSYWLQLGIVSWGSECGGKHPGFYTSVPSIMGWVWKAMNDSMKAIRCPPWKLTGNQKFESQNCQSGAKANSSCLIQCGNGFKFTGRNEPFHSVRCKLNDDMVSASWLKQTIPDCEAIRCSPWKLKVNQEYENKECRLGARVNSSCRIQCSKGFRFSGRNERHLSRRCQLNDDMVSASWLNQTIPDCEAIRCPPWKLNANQNFDDQNCRSGTRANSSCRVQCNKGFKFSERNEQFISVSCELNNDRMSASWLNQQIPTCEAIRCPPWKLRANQEFQNQNCLSGTKADSLCRVQCNRGFKFSGRKEQFLSVRCQLNADTLSASWLKQTIPSCEAIRCSPWKLKPNQNFADANCRSETKASSSCRVNCNKGFKFEGRNERFLDVQCALNDDKASASWLKQPIPDCEAIQCPPWKLKTNQEFQNKNCRSRTRVNSSCRVQCKNGFKFSGRKEQFLSVRCQINDDMVSASWIKQTIPDCEEIRCQPWKLKDNQILDNKNCRSGTRVNSSCRVQCIKGFKFAGNNEQFQSVRCQLNNDKVSASWLKQAIPDCEAIRCSPRKLQANQEFENKNCRAGTRVNSLCRVQCSEGFRFSGSNGQHLSLRCNLNDDMVSASWLKQMIPDCEAIRCPTWKLKANREFQDKNCRSGTGVNSLCQIQCNKGFKFSGTSKQIHSVRCQLNNDKMTASWLKQTVPGCEAIRCPPWKLKINQEIKNKNCRSGTYANTLCGVQCNKGFRFSGRTEQFLIIRCQLNDDVESASWLKRAIPDCEAIRCPPWKLKANQKFQDKNCRSGTGVNSLCQVQCNKGFKFSGTSKQIHAVRCQLNNDKVTASWLKQTVPGCEAIRCPPWKLKVNQEFQNKNCRSGTDANSDCRVQCKKGLRFSGRTEQFLAVRCQLNDDMASASWLNRAIPECEGCCCIYFLVFLATRPFTPEREDCVCGGTM